MTTKLAAVSLAASLAMTIFAADAQEVPATAAPADVHIPATASLESAALLESEPLTGAELEAAVLLADEPDVSLALPAAPETFAATEPGSATSATVVAEPGTWALLGLGIVGLGLARRRLAALGRDDAEAEAAHRRP